MPRQEYWEAVVDKVREQDKHGTERAAERAAAAIAFAEAFVGSSLFDHVFSYPSGYQRVVESWRRYARARL